VSNSSFNAKQLQAAFAAIEQHSLNVQEVWMSKQAYTDLKNWSWPHDEGELTIFQEKRLILKICKAVCV